MGWFNILKVSPITRRDKDNFAKLKEALKKEMGYEKFSHVEGKGLLDLEQWLSGNWPSPEEVTSGNTIGENLIARTWVGFSSAVAENYDEDIPHNITEILLDMSEIVDKLSDITTYM
tara:strand:+ start:512 stop:862 length:351 start_codon:yes stop_codon:yes gene_type:complete